MSVREVLVMFTDEVFERLLRTGLFGPPLASDGGLWRADMARLKVVRRRWWQ